MKQFKISAKITARDSIALEKYLVDINRIELLTSDQEYHLALRIQGGDEEAIHLLTRANLRFVVSVAKQYQHQGLSLIDLINEGNVGMIKAAKRFDPTKGFKFITYAVWWIRQSIMQAIRIQGRLIKLPQHKQDSFQKMMEFVKEFQQTMEREPSRMEIAEGLDSSINQINELVGYKERTASIDSPVLGDDSNITILDTIKGDEPLPDYSLLRESLSNDIKAQLSALPARECQVLKRSFGIGNQLEQSMSDIAEDLGITKERVRQIKDKALRKLKSQVVQSNLAWT